jgi:hypothetical protein
MHGEVTIFPNPQRSPLIVFSSEGAAVVALSICGVNELLPPPHGRNLLNRFSNCARKARQQILKSEKSQ